MSVAELEARALGSSISPVPREAAERVLDYLVFHRAMLDSGPEQSPLLDRYLALVRGLKEGVHIVIEDPFQKATALLFELVMEEAFDPWEIDLVRFTEVYLERVRSEAGIDFAVAGRLLYMAWSILYLQSEELLKLRALPPAASGDPVDAGDVAPGDQFWDSLETPEAVEVTETVLARPEAPPLEEMVRHTEARPVSLLELAEAFGRAEEEARRALRIEELRERLREEQSGAPEVLVHGDIPERDLADAWDAARTHAIGEAFPFLSLWRPVEGRDRLVALFLATLFLAREKAIELRQDALGESPLLIVRREESRPLPVRSQDE
jgi:segregation and condensation protein A